MKIVTFNISVGGDGSNTFCKRKSLIIKKIDSEMPDFIGFQELAPHMRDYLVEHLPDYNIVGRSRSADYKDEHMDIVYRKDKYDILALDFFWLSPTPYVPGSRYTEQSECPRITTVAMFKRKCDNKIFRIYNTHLDHVGELARVLGIKQIMDVITNDNKKIRMPFFLMGDFNTIPGSQAIEYVNTFKEEPVADLTSKLKRTFHAFGCATTDIKIDYIYTDINTSKLPHESTIWSDENNGTWLSDHYPVCCEIDF